MAKGSDYLVEVELGHAPPLQFIMANMGGDPQDPRGQGAKVHGDHDSSSDDGDEASDDDVPLQQLFDEIEHAMPATRRRIEMLRHGLEARPFPNPPSLIVLRPSNEHNVFTSFRTKI